MSQVCEAHKSRRVRGIIASFCAGKIDMAECRRRIGRDSEAWIEKTTGLSEAELESEMEAANMAVDGVPLWEFMTQREGRGSAQYVDEDDLPF